MNTGLDWYRGSVPQSLLDGEAGEALRKAIPLRVRRERGAFFTGSNLRAAALAQWSNWHQSLGPVLDPAVGAGDLLMEIARHLPIEKDLEQTLRLWGSLLHGRDVEPSFVRLAKARLVLLAVARGAAAGTRIDDLVDVVLPEIKVGDGLKLLSRGWLGCHIVMNPPFTHSRAPKDICWTTGRTSVAGLFLASAVQGAQAGTSLTAILPDVIRSGSRYQRLRNLVGNHLHVSAAEKYGRFDEWTDVDVFILRGVIAPSTSGESTQRWWDSTAGKVLGEVFDVRVGTVVPHRDPESGPLLPYLHARAIPLGGEFDVAGARPRGFQKRSFEPPFVVVRRTSRPGDKSRGTGTVICGKSGVFVENHLIVLSPRNGSIETCRSVVQVLSSPEAKLWLDERIRCRHLTVQALREMPWFNV